MADAAQVIGAINSITTILILILYLPCLRVIGFDPELRQGSCFKVGNNTAFDSGENILNSTVALNTSETIPNLIRQRTQITVLLDHVQSRRFRHNNNEHSIQLLFALLTATGLTESLPSWLNFSIAPILGGTWFSGTSFVLLLAVNRWSVMSQKLAFLFTPKATKILIGCVWVYSIAWLVVLQLPQVGYCYYPAQFLFYYGFNNSYSGLAKGLNYWHNQLTLWPAAILYVLAFLAARAERKAVGAAPTNELDSALRVTERKLLKQGACIFVWCWFVSEYWHSVGFITELGFEYAMALGNWLWMSNAAVNPTVYLGMNKTIKQKVRQLVKNGDVLTRGQNTRQIVHTNNIERIVVQEIL